MGQCGCQDEYKDHTFLEIPNYDKLLFIEHWRYCGNCGNPEGYDIQLISKEEFRGYQGFGHKIEGRVRDEDCLWKKKHHKGEKFCFITFADFLPRIKWMLKDFGKNDITDYNPSDKEVEAMSVINWKKFAEAFEKYLLQNCPKKRIMGLGL